MRLLIIAPLALKPAIDAASVSEFANGAEALVPALSGDGTAPATHGWLSAEFTAENAAKAQAMAAMPQFAGALVIQYDIDTQSADEVAAAHGLTRITPQNEP